MAICDGNCFQCPHPDCVNNDPTLPADLALMPPDEAAREVEKGEAKRIAYQEANKERRQAYKKAYREKNRDAINARRRARWQTAKGGPS